MQLIINYKSYQQAFGKQLLQSLSELSKFFQNSPDQLAHVFVAVPELELKSVKTTYPDLPIIAQSFDALDFGSNTGSIPPHILTQLGIEFSLLNHSEQRIFDVDYLQKLVKAGQSSGLKTIVCVENLNEAQRMLSSEPYAIAYEPPELIGTGRSVTDFREDEVNEFIKLFADTDTLPFIGAGIAEKEDIIAGQHMGAQGFVVASSIVKADSPVEKVKELILDI